MKRKEQQSRPQLYRSHTIKYHEKRVICFPNKSCTKRTNWSTMNQERHTKFYLLSSF
jgi:hypothetical protein